MNAVAEEEGREGRYQARGGIDDRLSMVSHGRNPPPERRRGCYARRRGRINAIKRVGTQSNGTRGPAELGGE